MRVYADLPDRRARQLAADAGALGWAVLWVLVARVVHRAVLLLADPGRAVEDLGRSIAGSMGAAAGAAGDVPVVGDDLAGPFAALGRAGNSVAGAGQNTQDAVSTLAAVLAAVLVVVPVGWMLLRWLPERLRWAREARAVDALLADRSLDAPELELLAARALATAPLPALAGLPAGTAAGWRAGDPAAVRALAGLELRRLGLRLPPGTTVS
jgi:hypothetical protein